MNRGFISLPVLLFAASVLASSASVYFYGELEEIKENNNTDQIQPNPSPRVAGTQVKEKSKTVTKTPTPKSQVKAAAPSEPKIDCTGPDGVVFQTTQKECDDFNNAWAKHNPENSTQKKVNAGSTYTYEAPNYQPCTINYKYGGPVTYNYMTPEQCEEAKKGEADIQAIWDSADPTPTPDNSAYEQAKAEHEAACAAVVSTWNSYKENFNYDGYGSSAQAVMALESQRQNYQNQLSNAGCSNTLSL